MYLVPGLAGSDLGLQGADLVLGLLQLSNTLTSSTLVLTELTLLLVNHSLKTSRNHISRVSLHTGTNLKVLIFAANSF